MAEHDDEASPEMVKITVYVSTNVVGSRCEFNTEMDKEEWDSMTDQERDIALHEELMQSGLVNWGYEVQE